MKVELNTSLFGIFSGTYGTAWEVTATDDLGNELDVEYEFTDLMKSIARVYQENRKDILDLMKESEIDFVSNTTFTGGFYSPREYNFSTDTLDLVVTLNKKKLVEKTRKLCQERLFIQYLEDNFTSCDGFMSFTPNNPKDLLESIEAENDEFDQSLGAILTYLAVSHDTDWYETIEGGVHEDWQGNGYGGLDYKVIGNWNE